LVFRIARPERAVMTNSVVGQFAQSALRSDLSFCKFRSTMPLMAAKYSTGARV
jgi:hypothetical protein